MFLATINKPKQLLYISLIGQVRAEEVAQGRKELAVLLEGLDPGFRLLTDLERLDSTDQNSASEIGAVMEMCDARGVELIVRVIPDETKDIGMNILSRFHYAHKPQMITCESMTEAARLLSL